MSQKANYFKLGLFVIGAIAAGIAVLLVIGTGRWLKPRDRDPHLEPAGARRMARGADPRGRPHREPMTVQDEPELLAILERSTRTGIHVIGLRVLTYAVGFVGSVLVARALGPGGRGRYVLPLTILTIVFMVTNLGLEQAQVYLAGRGTSPRAMWANATAVGVAVSVLVWVMTAIVVAIRPGLLSTPTSWIVLTFAQLPLLLHILYWLSILQLAGRVRSGVVAGAIASGAETLAILALYAGHALTPFRALVVVGAGNLITWGVLLGIGVQAGIVAFRIHVPSLRKGLHFGLRAQLGIVFTFLLDRKSVV